MEAPSLGQLINRFLQPIKGRPAQVELTRFMTRHLKIGSDAVPGFPTIKVVRSEIQETLCRRLIVDSQVKEGDEVIYFGTKYKVVKVHQASLTLDMGQGKASRGRISPLYCTDLVEKVMSVQP